MAKKVFLALIIVLLCSCFNPSLCSCSNPSRTIPSNALPNIQHVGQGFDSRVGDPVMDSIKFTTRIFQQTWQTNNTWIFDGQKYAIPDNYVAIATPSATQSTTSQVYTSSASVASGIYSSQTSGFSGYSVWGIKIIPGMYSTSARVNFFSDEVQHLNYTGFSYLEIKEWKVGINSTLAINATHLDPYFNSHLTTLPSQFNYATCPQFKRFISRFGTHFFQEAIWGGQMVMQSSFTESQYDQQHASGVSDDLSELFILSTKDDCTSFEQQEFAALNAQYETTIWSVGGDPSKYRQTDWSEWAKSIPCDPVPLSMGLVPLYSLIPKSDGRHSALDTAIQTYLGTGLQLAPMPTPRTSLAAVAANNIIFFIGGDRDTGGITNVVEAYNTTENTWTTLAPMPTARRGLAAAIVKGFIYCVGGDDGYFTPMNTVEKYDISTNEWTTVKSMPTTRSDLAVAAVGGVIYAAGGYNEYNVMLDTMEIYNPYIDKWVTSNPMPTPRMFLAAASLNNDIYFVGGAQYATSLNTVESYNTITDRWNTRASMPTYHSDLAAVTVNGLIYVLGGYNDQVRALNTMAAYNPSTNRWNKMTSMPTARSGLAAAAVDNIIYCGGGYGKFFTALNKTEAYYPASNDWRGWNACF